MAVPKFKQVFRAEVAAAGGRVNAGYVYSPEGKIVTRENEWPTFRYHAKEAGILKGSWFENIY